MKITRKSLLSGKTRTKELNITEAQLLDYESGTVIQNPFPNLTPDDREFFMTGISGDEWDSTFDDMDYDD